MSPRRLLAVLAVLSALLVPAAVAWACNPSPSMKTDKLSYTPGEQMTVSGRYFSTKETSTKEKNAVTLTTDPAGASAGPVTVRRTGTFRVCASCRVKLEAPDQAGAYTLLATNSNGTTAQRAAFEVASPSSTPPPPNEPARVEFVEPGVERSEVVGAGAPQRDPQQVGNGSGDQGNGSGERTVFQSAPAPAPRTTGGGSFAGSSGGSDGGGGSGSSGSGGGTNGDGGAASGREDGGVTRVPAGRSVFVDSLAPADRRAGGAGRTTTAAEQPAGRGGPSERAATGDLWGGFRSGKTPSLVPGDGSADDGGSGASIGLGLLGLGLVGLLSALAVAQVRRRRALAG